MIKPLFMWAGGKTKMVKHYKPFLPKTFDTYIEPFFGAGAMLLEAIKINPKAKLVIGDINSSIINIYKSIQTQPKQFIEKMDELSSAYLPLSKEDRKAFYYNLRNEHAFEYQKYNSTAEEAAVLYFLMKTGFNGIWQINKNTNNRFGTPCGLLNQKDSVYDPLNVASWHRILKEATIINGDYKQTLQYVTKNTWVFMDPPYRGGFTTYGTEFGDTEQMLVMEAAKALHEGHKANVWVTNRDVGDGFFDLYKSEFDIHRFPVTYTAGRRKKTDTGFEAKKAVELLLCVRSL